MQTDYKKTSMASADNKNRPKATQEVVKEYDEIIKVLNTLNYDNDYNQISILENRINELEETYDWFNIIFTDPSTGKKGMKDVSGNIIVSANYDDIAEPRSYMHSPYAPVIAIKEGKYGIVKGDGSEKVLCDFRFDWIESIHLTSLYYARWNGLDGHYGIITAKGNVICPNFLTSYYEPFNGILIIESDKKLGVIDLETYQCVLPEYDDLDADPDQFIVFHKDGKEWYITDGGERITKDQFENDENYADAYCLNTFN